jgi:cell division protein FtsQ
MPRKTSAATVDLPSPLPRSAARFLNTLGSVFNCFIAICALIGCLWAVWQIEQFVIADPRFQLQGPPDPGIPSGHFQIVGLKNASEQQIVNVFARDFGRSLYLCPIRERRRRLLAIDWVKEASVSRVWPNRVVVRIEERKPVAFVQIPAGDKTMFYGMVDEQGVILDPQRSGPMSLAVLTGVSPREPESIRRERVRRFLRLRTELGLLMDEISEIDVSDLDNLKVLQAVDGRVVTLMLGDQQFLQRYRNFIDNSVEISKRLGDAVVLDLRLKDRITAVAAAGGEAVAAAEPPRKLRPRELKR